LTSLREEEEEEEEEARKLVVLRFAEVLIECMGCGK